MTIDPDMEVFKKYLDGLPKIGLDYLEESLEEGDAIYEIFGASRDFGGLIIIKIAQGIEGKLSFFYDNPLTN